MTHLSLRQGRLLVEIDPEAGGSLTRFAVDGRDLLRAGRGVRQCACFPLVPYSNRIANGRFEFEGRTVQVPRNWPDPAVRHPMHGDGWAASWTVVRADAVSATLAFEHDGRQGWPFRYRATQSFRLEGGALGVRIGLENRETGVRPGGIGLHPFFVREPDCELLFDADHVWLSDAEVLPTRRVATPNEWDFCHGRRPDDLALDNCFDDWDGRASVVRPSRRLRLELAASEPFRHCVVFTPPSRAFFCFEPVSHANGRIGDTRIAAGATLSGEVEFRIADLVRSHA